jgi:hypothetical protein
MLNIIKQQKRSRMQRVKDKFVSGFKKVLPLLSALTLTHCEAELPSPRITNIWVETTTDIGGADQEDSTFDLGRRVIDIPRTRVDIRDMETDRPYDFYQSDIKQDTKQETEYDTPKECTPTEVVKIHNVLLKVGDSVNAFDNCKYLRLDKWEFYQSYFSILDSDNETVIQTFNIPKSQDGTGCSPSTPTFCGAGIMYMEFEGKLYKIITNFDPAPYVEGQDRVSVTICKKNDNGSIGCEGIAGK